MLPRAAYSEALESHSLYPLHNFLRTTKTTLFLVLLMGQGASLSNCGRQCDLLAVHTRGLDYGGREGVAEPGDPPGEGVLVLAGLCATLTESPLNNTVLLLRVATLEGWRNPACQVRHTLHLCLWDTTRAATFLLCSSVSTGL